MLSVAVVIPALNEATAIYTLIEDLRSQPRLPDNATIIVVNNGSTDATAERATAAGAQVVDEPRRGYGYACAAGVQAAIAADVVVFLDADHSSRPDEIGGLLEPLYAGRADLVLGSRVLGAIRPGSMPYHQRFGNWLAANVMRGLYDISVTDLGPYRAIRRKALLDLDMREMTFGWPTEMMVKAARRGFRIVEVPVSHEPRHSGRSKVSGTLRGSIMAAYYILGVTLKHAR